MRSLLHTAGFEREPKAALQGGATHRTGGGGAEPATVTLGREEQRGMAMGFPLLAQQVQGALGQRDVTILLVMESFP